MQCLAEHHDLLHRHYNAARIYWTVVFYLIVESRDIPNSLKVLIPSRCLAGWCPGKCFFVRRTLRVTAGDKTHEVIDFGNS